MTAVTKGEVKSIVRRLGFDPDRTVSVEFAASGHGIAVTVAFVEQTEHGPRVTTSKTTLTS